MISRDLLTPEDIGVETRIVILCQLEIDILVKLQLRISILGIFGRKLHNIQDHERHKAIHYLSSLL